MPRLDQIGRGPAPKIVAAEALVAGPPSLWKASTFGRMVGVAGFEPCAPCVPNVSNIRKDQRKQCTLCGLATIIAVCSSGFGGPSVVGLAVFGLDHLVRAT